MIGASTSGSAVSGSLSMAGGRHCGDFYLDVARGLVPGVSFVNKFGRNPDVDSGAGVEDVWAAGGTRTYLSSAETMDVVSDSSEDSAAGTGTRTLMVSGLDASYNEVSETITLNGVSAVTTVNSYLRLHRAYTLTVGSAESNVGTITIDPTSSGPSARQGSIVAGDGQTMIALYTVPAGKTGYMVGNQISVTAKLGTTGAKIASAFLRERLFGNGWRTLAQYGVQSLGTSVTPDVHYNIPVEFPEKTDIRWQADAENNNTLVYVQFSLILFDN